MNLKNNTILITGGSSGVGLELCKQLHSDNKLIICGRSLSKLEAVKLTYPSVVIYPCDISKKEALIQFSIWLKEKYPDLNVLLNNAAIVHKVNFKDTLNILEMAELEVRTNFLAPIHLTKVLLPILEKNSQSAIINITTGLVYCPRADYPFYSATKAALHSFTQVIREQLKKEDIAIIEVLFPAIDTPWHKGNPPKIAIPVEKAVKEMLVELKTGKLEIRVGAVKLLYGFFRMAPNFAFKKINGLSNT